MKRWAAGGGGLSQGGGSSVWEAIMDIQQKAFTCDRSSVPLPFHLSPSLPPNAIPNMWQRELAGWSIQTLNHIYRQSVTRVVLKRSCKSKHLSTHNVSCKKALSTNSDWPLIERNFAFLFLLKSSLLQFYESLLVSVGSVSYKRYTSISSRNFYLIVCLNNVLILSWSCHIYSNCLFERVL